MSEAPQASRAVQRTHPADNAAVVMSAATGVGILALLFFIGAPLTAASLVLGFAFVAYKGAFVGEYTAKGFRPYGEGGIPVPDEAWRYRYAVTCGAVSSAAVAAVITLVFAWVVTWFVDIPHAVIALPLSVPLAHFINIGSHAYTPTKKGEGVASSRFADAKALEYEGLNAPMENGIIFGRMGDLIVVSEGQGGTFNHVLTVSPPGGGKGIGIVQPTLLKYKGSSVVLDPKGENFKKCSAAMRKNGIDVRVLDPWGITGAASASINPLKGLSIDDEDIKDEVKAIADGLVVRVKTEDAYWDDNTVTILASLLIGVLAYGEDEDRHLGGLREIIDWLPEQREELFQAMTQNPHPVVRQAGVAIRDLQSAEKEWRSLWTNVRKVTDILDSKAVVATLKQTDLSIVDLRTRNVAIFLVLPGEKLKSHGALMRLWLTTIMTPLIKAGEAIHGRLPILFLLDEVFSKNLGRLDSLETQLTLMRGYGMRVCMIAQTLGQISALYGEDGMKTILGATNIKAYFGIGDLETAEYVSKMLGERENWVETQDRGKDRKVKHLQTRALRTPDEIMRTSQTEVFYFQQGMDPALLRRINVNTDAEFRDLITPAAATDAAAALPGQKPPAALPAPTETALPAPVVPEVAAAVPVTAADPASRSV